MITGIVYCRNSVGDSSSLTPVKPRLGRFVDVYSPEHLNIIPRPVSNLFIAKFNTLFV